MSPVYQLVWQHSDPRRKYFAGSWESGDFGPQLEPFSTRILGREYSENRQKARGPKSTISVTDFSRRCTVGKLPIRRWADAPSGKYISSWTPTCLQRWDAAARISPRKLEIREVRNPNRILFGLGSRAVVKWGSPENSGTKNDHFSNRFRPYLRSGEVVD